MHLKLTCPDRHLYEGSSYAEVVAMSRAVIERAPGRVIWGTDWPHAYVFDPNRMPNDGDLIDMLLDFAPDEAVRHRILVEAPNRLFGSD
jgi:predicted TIM-barrel fold metal-dependent hydrolase